MDWELLLTRAPRPWSSKATFSQHIWLQNTEESPAVPFLQPIPILRSLC